MEIHKSSKQVLMILTLILVIISSQTALAALYTTPEKHAPQMVYFVDSEDLETLKQALVAINLRLREDGRSREMDYKVFIDGGAVKLFDKDAIDSELKYMVEWFLREQIKVALCVSCILKYGVKPDSILPGLALYDSQKKYKSDLTK